MKEKASKMKDVEMITAKIKEITQRFPYYGYRKVYTILKYKEKIQIHRNKVYKIMRENNLLLPASRSNKKLFKGVPFSLKVEATESNKLWGIEGKYYY